MVASSRLAMLRYFVQGAFVNEGLLLFTIFFNCSQTCEGLTEVATPAAAVQVSQPVVWSENHRSMRSLISTKRDIKQAKQYRLKVMSICWINMLESPFFVQKTKIRVVELQECCLRCWCFRLRSITLARRKLRFLMLKLMTTLSP